jgi:hypothetical protein
VLRAAAYATGVEFADAESDEQAFPDVGPDNVHFERVNGAAELDLVEGRTDGDYHPARSTERAQMASVVIRALIHAEPDTAGSSDVSTASADGEAATPAVSRAGMGGEENLALLLLLLLPVAVVYGRRRRDPHSD